MAADYKAKYCKKCTLPRLCICGCGKMITSKFSKYAPGCFFRGKTYTELYGNDVVCGFKKGLHNPMNNEVSVRKMLSRISKRDKLYNGIYFRSTYEINTYKKLIQMGKIFIYEPLIKTPNKTYMPDFVVYDNGVPIEVYEVSGYGSFNEQGRNRNINKANDIVSSYPHIKYYIITDKKYMDYYKKYDNIYVVDYAEFIKDVICGK
jgi:hypothetical protein